MARLFVCLAAVLLSGCATIVNGTSQTVAVNSTPQGASCSVDRGGSTLNSIAATPSIVPVSKSINSLVVTCSKPGYKTATTSASSSFNGWTFGNILIGGLVGVAVDASTGANFDYPHSVDVAMTPDPAATISGRSEGAGPSLGSIAARSLMTTRAMAQPAGSRTRLAFLQGACSAGDESACIVAEADHPGVGSRRARHN